jgi:small nuclear ribonucleoprotein (snRNP)-like protein
LHERFSVGLSWALVLVLSAGGCAKLTPASTADFGAEKSVLVTLRDGETIKGHIDVGENVIFTTFGRVYRAEVESVSDNGDIVLANAYIQEEYDKFWLQRERMEDATLRVTDDTQRISIPAYKVVKVEEVSMDRMKSARAAGFWGFTVFVVARIMNTRF